MIRRLSFSAALAAILASPIRTEAQESVPLPPRIGIGEATRGTLDRTEGARLSRRGPFAAYRFEGRAGQRYVADALSDDFDASLLLLRPQGAITEEIGENDDGGEGTNARMTFTLETDRIHYLVVHGWGEESRGAFELRLEERPLPPPRTPRPLPESGRISGRLSEASSIAVDEWGNEIVHDLWIFEGEGGSDILITLDSNDFDPLVSLGTMAGDAFTELARDDDGGGALNAALFFRLPHDGRYGIRAYSYSEAPRGDYELRMERIEPLDPVERTIRIGESATDRLDLRDPRLEDGHVHHVWTFPGLAGESIRIRLTSDAFDPVLVLGRIDESGEFIQLDFNDDGPDGGLNSRIDRILPLDGEYRIQVRGWSEASSGDYTLAVENR